MADENKPNTPPEPGKPETAPVPPKPEGAQAAPKPAAPAAAAPKPPAPPPKPAGPTPQPWDNELTARLKKMYGSGIRESSTYVGQPYLVVDKSLLHDILVIMCKDEQFDYCVDITAVHYPKKDEQFELIYILYSFPNNIRVRVKASIKEDEEVPTVTDIWPTADWLEREVFDMFGIKFAGHPNLTRILLPDGWKGYPLRKDYPILLQDKEWVQINIGIESGQ